MRRDRDTVTPEWIAQAISFSFSFFFSFFKQCLNNKFLVVFFFWKNNSPRPPTFSFELQKKKKKHLCSHFTVHYSTIISVLPSSLLAVSVLARTDGGRRPFVFRSFSSFSSFSSFFFLVALDETSSSSSSSIARFLNVSECSRRSTDRALIVLLVFAHVQ